MFTFFYVIDLTQDFNSKCCLSIAKKATVISFLEGIFVNIVTCYGLYQMNETKALSTGFIT
jgi:hypothetical protein